LDVTSWQGFDDPNYFPRNIQTKEVIPMGNEVTKVPLVVFVRVLFVVICDGSMPRCSVNSFGYFRRYVMNRSTSEAMFLPVTLYVLKWERKAVSYD